MKRVYLTQINTQFCMCLQFCFVSVHGCLIILLFLGLAFQKQLKSNNSKPVFGQVAMACISICGQLESRRGTGGIQLKAKQCGSSKSLLRGYRGEKFWMCFQPFPVLICGWSACCREGNGLLTSSALNSRGGNPKNLGSTLFLSKQDLIVRRFFFVSFITSLSQKADVSWSGLTVTHTQAHLIQKYSTSLIDLSFQNEFSSKSFCLFLLHSVLSPFFCIFWEELFILLENIVHFESSQFFLKATSAYHQYFFK